jgi:prepilin-type N-terminal cleavage/methylation domain-containing protein
VVERRHHRGFSLFEMMFVLALIGVVSVLVWRPLTTLLNYPKRTIHQRTDRIAGQEAYNKLYYDLRNAVSNKVWSTTTDSGDTLVLFPAVVRYDNADSDGRLAYIFWRYSQSKSSLARRSWLQAELSGAGLPAPAEVPTEAEWQSFEQQTLKPVAYFMTKFSLTYDVDSGTDVSYSIKNPKREGKVDQYDLRVDN